MGGFKRPAAYVEHKGDKSIELVLIQRERNKLFNAILCNANVFVQNFKGLFFIHKEQQILRRQDHMSVADGSDATPIFIGMGTECLEGLDHRFGGEGYLHGGLIIIGLLGI